MSVPLLFVKVSCASKWWWRFTHTFIVSFKAFLLLCHHHLQSPLIHWFDLNSSDVSIAKNSFHSALHDLWYITDISSNFRYCRREMLAFKIIVFFLHSKSVLVVCRAFWVRMGWFFVEFTEVGVDWRGVELASIKSGVLFTLNGYPLRMLGVVIYWGRDVVLIFYVCAIITSCWTVVITVFWVWSREVSIFIWWTGDNKFVSVMILWSIWLLNEWLACLIKRLLLVREGKIPTCLHRSFTLWLNSVCHICNVLF